MVIADKRILITGAAGFIGSSLAYKLLEECKYILCLDNFSDYYSKDLKESRKKRLDKKAIELKVPDYSFEVVDLKYRDRVESIVDRFKPDVICHLAAQAGVRYSIEYPQSYIDNNITATLNILECANNSNVENIIFASTSSVYGLSEEMPFNEEISIDSTISTYAATKRSCELLCHTYNKLYGIKFRILRFFTVYGPWGRPDMALFRFTKSILQNQTINVVNNGKMNRDFTYIDDIVCGFISAIKTELDYEIINLGCGNPINLMDFIEVLENKLGIISDKNYLPIQQGDVHSTHADISKAKRLLSYNPNVNVEEGISNFVKWYLKYYDI